MEAEMSRVFGGKDNEDRVHDQRLRQQMDADMKEQLDWLQSPEAKQEIENALKSAAQVTEELRKEHQDDWKKLRDTYFNI
jgi:hypothetical protein